MHIIDWNIYRDAVLFTIKHHGTRTQGEDYRLEQVSDCIVELTQTLMAANDAMNTVSDTNHIIVISVKH